jgi:chemotaxis protein methyltransferase CheR
MSIRPGISNEEFDNLRDLFSSRLGILLQAESRSTLERKLKVRLSERFMYSYADYEHFLRYGQDNEREWEVLIDLLAVHETYFFRHPEQLAAISEEVLPAIHAAGSGRLRMWSAPCSTGEEAYTLAMMVKEARVFDDWDVRIFGTDISASCVRTARRAVYAEGAFRTRSPRELEPFVRRTVARPSMLPGVKSQGALWEVDASIRSMCRFGTANLLDASGTPLNGVDVALCRNLLIYMDDRARRSIVSMLYERLVPGGILVLGHAESLLNVSTDFELLPLKRELVYRKPT